MVLGSPAKDGGKQLKPGTQISHYKIIEKLGQGGMGEVYLAEDSRLDRKVALKILPQHLSERAELRERFEREARAVSSLNHPHICTLYDIGEQDGIHYLVMEHLVGGTLESRLAKGPLPLEQTLEYAIQIADALDKAHRQGVVHRDLKPGNIMLTKSGAKLLDFGLAKLQAAETPTNLSALPTEQANLTAEGTILGTLQYMAPEQLEAKEADSRTDIFAFGAVVYEMATGKKAFEGSSQASLIAAIMGQDPRPMAELQPMTPSVLDWVVDRCLVKEPDGRVQSAADLMAELRLVSEVGTPVGPSPSVTGPAAWRRAIPWGITAVVVVITGVLLWSVMRSAPLFTPQVTRLTFRALPEQEINASEDPVPLALSPDGRRLVYAAEVEGVTQLYRRDLDQLEVEPIPGTEGAHSPFFSPDGQWVGFSADRMLQKVALAGGAPLKITDVPSLNLGASWGKDGTIIYAVSGFGLLKVSDNGGDPEVLTDLGEKEFTHAWPQILPNGKSVLFTIQAWSDSAVVLLSLETGEQRELLPGADRHSVAAQYLPTGHLVYPQSGGLVAAPWDSTRDEVGEPRPVLESVHARTWNGMDVAVFTVSPTGSLVYAADPVQDRLVWVDREGQERPLTESQSAWQGYPRLSPDSQRLTWVRDLDTGAYTIYVQDISRPGSTRLTTDRHSFMPVWSLDGTRITFASRREGSFDLYWKTVDEVGEAELLLSSEGQLYPGSWSPAGLVFTEQNPTTGTDLYILPSGTDQGEAYLVTEYNEHSPRFSPDGRWVAYTSNESGRDEVWVQPYPATGKRWQISADGGTEPVWSGDGRELFYRSGEKAQHMMVVVVRTEPEFTRETPQRLFTGRYNDHGVPGNAAYDVSFDGTEFVMARESIPDATQINVVLNWFEELKRLVPTDK